MRRFRTLIPLSPEETREALELGRARHRSVAAVTKNSHNFYASKPAAFRHETGAIVEVGYSKWSGYPVERRLGVGDDGTDFPPGVQVKGTHYATGDLMIPVAQYSRKVGPGVVYFVLGRRLGPVPAVPGSAVVELAGWVRRTVFEELAERRTTSRSGKALPAEAYVFRYEALEPMERFAEIDRVRIVSDIAPAPRAGRPGGGGILW